MERVEIVKRKKYREREGTEWTTRERERERSKEGDKRVTAETKELDQNVDSKTRGKRWENISALSHHKAIREQVSSSSSFFSSSSFLFLSCFLSSVLVSFRCLSFEMMTVIISGRSLSDRERERQRKTERETVTKNGRQIVSRRTRMMTMARKGRQDNGVKRWLVFIHHPRSLFFLSLLLSS